MQAIVGEETKLEGTVQPSNATNQTIVWSVVAGNANIVNKSDGAYLKPHVAGAVKVRATIANGITQ